MSYPMWNEARTGILIDRGSGILAFVESGAEFEALKGTASDWHQYPISAAPPVPIEEQRAEMRCTPMQGILALGEDEWAKVTDYRDNHATWAQRVVIDSALDWRRNSENIAFFQHLLQYTDEQVDDLFRAAMQIEA